jgi:restriction system protein
MLEILFFIGIVAVVFLFRELFRGDGINVRGPHRNSGERTVSRRIQSLIATNPEYKIFNNVILRTPYGTTQIDHVLLSPYGIFVIETKDFNGWIFGQPNEKRWTQSLRRGYSLLSRLNQHTFQFQNPLRQNDKHVEAVQNFLGVKLSSVFNVVVFVGDSTFMRDMPANVMELDGLLPYIQSRNQAIFTNETVTWFSERLQNYINLASPTEEDHIKNLRENLRGPICPRCGKRMVVRIARNGPDTGSKFWGCANYPRCTVIKEK